MKRPWPLRLLGLLLPSWRFALLGIGLSLLALAANLALLSLSGWFITAMAIAGTTGLALDTTTPAAAIRALALGRAGGRYAERLVNHETTLRILATIRVWFFRRLEPLAPARLQAHRSGDLLGRIRSDVDTLDDFYVRGVVPTMVAVLALAALVLVLGSYDGRLAAVDCCGLALGGLLVPLALLGASRPPGRERVALSSGLRASVVEQAQGMAELMALGAVAERSAAVQGLIDRLDRREARLALVQGLGDAGMIAASSLAVWTAALLLAPAVTAGALPGARFAMLVMLVAASFEAVMPLPLVLQRAGELAAAARRLFQLIDARPAAPDPVRPVPPPWKAREPLGLRIRGLRFRYSSDAPRVFDGFDLEVPAGSRVGITGPSGAGKSTLVSLLLRFWDYEGSIAITTARTGPVELSSLCGTDAVHLFSVLPQSPFLFHASIRENLQVARPEGEEPREEELRSAIESAELGALLDALPEGLETTVGERGHELSAGEARRLAVARALLKDAPFYLLDEPTEGLDDGTASRLMSGLAERLRGKTLLVISHRPRDFAMVERLVRLP